MKTLEDFRQYFSENLSRELARVESVRKQTIVKAVLAFVVTVAVAAIAIWPIAKFMGQEYFVAITVLNLLVGFFLGYMFYRELINSRAFYNLFKNRVVDGIVRYVDDRLRYVPHRYVSVAIFGRSKLFNKSVHEYEGDDYVFLQLESGIFLEFSEVHAFQKVKGKGKEPVFEGLFAHVKAPESRGGDLYIVPKDFSEENLSQARLQKYLTENTSFDQFYNVYTSSMMTAKRYLTPQLIEAFADHAHRTTEALPMYASHGPDVYIALPRTRTLFEPDVWQSVTDVKSLEAFFMDISELWRLVGVVVDLSGQVSVAAPTDQV